MTHEIAKGQYVIVEDEEFEAVEIESTRIIEIDQFVPKDEVDERYIDSPYYIAPDGQVGQDAFAVIRDTIAKMNMVALGRVVLTRREHIIALEPKGRGLLGLTLRYPYEVRDEKDYFEDIPELKLPKDMLDLASHSSKQNQATSIRLISRIDTKTRLLTYSRRNKLGKRLSPFGERPRHAW